VGNNTAQGFPNGVTQTRTYDRASRLNTIVTAGPGGPIGGFAYTRDVNGNPIGVDVSGPAGVIPVESMRNTFDNADRLTRTCFTTTTCTTANQTVWTYDRVGNRLTEKIGSGAVSTYTYDSADQLTLITGPGAGSFTYNANGDQLTAGADTFTYNTARQTVTATVGGVTSQYGYDGNGNRHTVTTAGTTTQEVWDTIGGLPTLVAQRDSAGVVLRRYTYAGITPVRYDDVTGGTVGYYQTDAVGTVTNLTTPTGTVGATYRYNPYGTQRPATSVLPAYTANPLKYAGQQQDPTGNYNLRARHYNPTRGSFTQTDPLPLGAGVAYESSYVYVYDNPLRFVDPNGKRGVLAGLGNPVQFGNAEGDSSGVNPTDLSGKDPKNTSYCNKPYPSRTRMCGSFAKASAAALWASSGLASPGERNACRHCVWSYLLVSQLGWKDAYFFMTNHEAFQEGNRRVQFWRDRSQQVTAQAWKKEPDVIDSAVDWNNNHFGGDLGLQDSALLFASARQSAVSKCQAALNNGQLDTRALEDR
jgi:RHS repeat-associated protein